MKLVVTCLVLSGLSYFQAYGATRTTKPGYISVRRVEYGLASWYGDHEQGRLMASGVPFNQFAMIAAHRTLPLGTTVKVTNMRNGRSVVVRIMDRGPHVAGRAIDLSKAAAERLRFTHQGLAPVSMRVLSTPTQQGREAEPARHAAQQHGERAPSAGTSPQRKLSSRQPEAFTRQ
jgi:rare lipoprotein A